MIVEEVLLILDWISKLVPFLLDLREAAKTNDPAQEFAAARKLIRAMKAQETKEAIRNDAVFLNDPFSKEDPWTP